MTGTAVTEAEELHEIYKLDVLVIPTNEPMVRDNMPDLIYRAQEAKFRAVVDEIVEKHEQGRPVLVGTVAIETSEHLSELLGAPRRQTRGAERQAARARGGDRGARR